MIELDNDEQNDREHGYLIKLILINYFVEIVMLIFLIIKG